jgi:protein-S-isoprenylcysteine O-methyltransferase Ste14
VTTSDFPTRQKPPGYKFGAYLMLVLAGLLGWASLLLLAMFLFVGSLNLVNLDLSQTAALILDACLCLAFFLQHSIMVRKSYRKWSARFIPAHYHGASYTIVSGLVLLTLVVFWQNPANVPAASDGILWWFLRAVYFLSIVGFVWGVRALGSFDSFGLQPIRDYLNGTNPRSIPFTIRGPYRWVRHPLYLFCLLMIWSYPELTADRLLFNVLWTAWIIFGTLLEERDLVADFGQDYREYQKNVPMLIPTRKATTNK